MSPMKKRGIHHSHPHRHIRRWLIEAGSDLASADVQHSHKHHHSSSLYQDLGGVPYHRPHTHSLAEEHDLRQQARRNLGGAR